MYIELEKVKEISSSVKLGKDMKDLLHKELCLGMTRYVCRYGTLSDGGEKITPAQRYYQAIKEMYTRALSIENLEADAMEAEANLIDAEAELAVIEGDTNKLRAQAKVKRCKSALTSALVSAEDTLRQYDEFYKVYMELQPEVRAMYPEGIEQAEEDNWIAVAEYRSLLKQMGQNTFPTHVPLPQELKAKIGLENNTPELTAWLWVDKKKDILAKTGGDFKAYLAQKYNDLRLIK